MLSSLEWNPQLPPRLEFSADGETALQFRISGRLLPKLAFKGVEIARLRALGSGARVPQYVLTEMPGIHITSKAGCYIDAINGGTPRATFTASSAEALTILGWVADIPNDQVRRHALVRLTSAGRSYYVRAVRLERPDVARHFGQPGLSRSGFSMYVLPALCRQI